MSENNLFQFAQVITEMPLQTTSQQPQHTEASSYRARYIPIRKVINKWKLYFLNMILII
jgi:hypothetical protein